MTARAAIFVVALVGCVDAAEPTAERDVAEVSSLLGAIDVSRTVALATDPEGTLQLDDGCRVDLGTEPAGDEADTPSPGAHPATDGLAGSGSDGPDPLLAADPHPADADFDGVVELARWEGPCLLADGALLEGTLTHTRTHHGMVVSAEAFSITEGDTLEVALSGAIELARVDHLLQVQLSLHACGPVGPACAPDAADPTLGLDLDYSIYPMDTFPQAYSVSLSGAVDGASRFVSVEGAWQTDTTDCPSEPAEGSVVLGTLPRQTLTLDGVDACDGCVGWQVEGIDVAPLCELEVW